MWELDNKKGWVLKNGCFWTVVLEKTLESSLDSKEIKPANPKGDQSWVFTGKTDAEAPLLSTPNAKSRLIWKDNDAGKDWRRRKDDRGWDGWVDLTIHPTRWTRIWANFRRCWRTGQPGVLQSMKSQRVRRDWTTITSWQVLIHWNTENFKL